MPGPGPGSGMYNMTDFTRSALSGTDGNSRGGGDDWFNGGTATGPTTPDFASPTVTSSTSTAPTFPGTTNQPSAPVPGMYNVAGRADRYPATPGAPPVSPAPTAPSGYMLNGGSGTFGYHFDPASGQYVDASGKPATPTSSTSSALAGGGPVANPGVNPFIGGTGLQSNPAYTASPGSGFVNQALNQNYFATPEAAAAIASQLGGTVVARNYGLGGNSPDQLFIQLPNGMMVNAGNLLSIYQNPVFQQNQGVMNGEVLKLLNSGLNPDTMQPVQTQGSYGIGADGKIAFNGSAPYQAPPEYTIAPNQAAAYMRAGVPLTSGPFSPLSNAQPQAAPQGGGSSMPRSSYYNPYQSNSYLNGLAQLAQFYQMFGGGGGGAGAGGAGGFDMNTLIALISLLGGQNDVQGGLYSRSQYPRFP